uniref:Bm5000 n=1 Tax=Brugia malayi TaxID=6279 RepID=A0A7I4KKH4_BRUMA
MSEECKIFAAYFGTIEVRRSATKSRVILRNYLQQRVSQFQIDEMAHCDMQPKETIKTKVEDFLICTTSHSCYLARNRASGEPSLYRIFTDNKTDDFQVLQFGSDEPILQLSAVQISAYGNATWLKRSDHWELTFGSTKLF